MDLIALAFWTDSTRVASCMLANTNSRIHYDFMGVNSEFHYVSHHVRNKKGAAGLRQHQHVAHLAVAVLDREAQDIAGREQHGVRQFADPLGLGH